MNRDLRRAGALAFALVLQGAGAAALAHDRDDDDRHGRHGQVTGGPLRVACDALAAALSIPDTVFTASSSIPAGTLKLAGQDVRAHCRLTGKMFPRVSPVDGKSYAIGFEMRLPLEWNGRYWYQANGGIDGSVVPATGNTSGGGPLTSALLQGFAVISSDAGHDNAVNGGPAFGFDPQARLDYGYQAVGKLTPMAKQVIREAYGKGPGRSYIGGCSNGGRHAMVAAARYANQYDGYLVGAPGFNLPLAATANIYGAQQYAPNATQQPPTTPAALETAWTLAERRLVAGKVVERCDALDGLTDGLVQNTEVCQKVFRLAHDVPTCGGPRDGTCLTTGQKLAIGNIFAGARDSRGRRFYASFPYDGGIGGGGISFWEFTAPLALDSGAVGAIFKVPPDPAALANGAAFSLGADIDTLLEQIFATDATYTESAMSFMTPPQPERIDDRLRRTDARMIVYHGVSDPIFSIDDTTRWYESLPKRKRGHGHERHARHDDDTDDVVRFFRVPGMGHCSGGPAADQFDMLSALVQWVEEGKAPRRVTASARGAGNVGGVNAEVPPGWAPDRTRPLCPYPRIARYHGGDPERAESFVCR